MGALGTAAMASMDQRLLWFRAMSAENRSWLGLVAQAGVAAFVDWVKHPERTGRPWRARFSAPRPASWPGRSACSRRWRWSASSSTWSRPRSTSWRRRAARPNCGRPCSATPGRSRSARPRFYARTAEARGAWDARLEALVVDSLVRGEVDEGLQSWASALNWSSGPVTVIVGSAERQRARGPDRRARVTLARRARLDLLAGVHGNRLVVVVGGTDDPIEAARHFAGRFGPGPVVAGPAVDDLQAAGSVRRRGAGRPARCVRPGPRRRGRSWPATCCPSAPSTATRPPEPQLIERGVRAAATRRHGAARHRDDLPGAGRLAGGDGADCSSCTRIPCATGCAGSPS